MPYRYGGKELTGLADLKGTLVGRTAVICCSGTTLARYDDDRPPKDWLRVAVNEAILKLQTADYWVIADDPIVFEYAEKCPKATRILAMQQATTIIRRHCKEHWIRTVESMSAVKDPANGYQFFSRGTVLIGGIEMLRWMGVRRFYVFGLDCYRTEKAYYYDGRKPIPLSEKHFTGSHRVRDGVEGERIYVTDRLKWAIDRLSAARAAGLWDDVEIRCVDSPRSQQTAIEKMTIEEFVEAVKASKTVPAEALAEAVAAIADEPSSPLPRKRRRKRTRSATEPQAEDGSIDEEEAADFSEEDEEKEEIDGVE